MFGSDWFWITLAGYALLAPLAALLLGWWALRRGRDLRTELARLRLELRQVGQQTPETDGLAEQVTPAPEEKPVGEPPVPDAGPAELLLSTPPSRHSRPHLTMLYAAAPCAADSAVWRADHITPPGL